MTIFRNCWASPRRCIELRVASRLWCKRRRIVAKHKDQESLELLFRSVSMLGEFPVLPEREGHEQFQITEEESRDNAEDGIDVNAVNVPRPL